LETGAGTMRALLCRELGSPDSLRVEDITRPEPGEGQVRIRVQACSINFPDLLQNFRSFPAAK